MKTSMLAILPLALAAGVMAANEGSKRTTTPEPKPEVKHNQRYRMVDGGTEKMPEVVEAFGATLPKKKQDNWYINKWKKGCSESAKNADELKGVEYKLVAELDTYDQEDGTVVVYGYCGGRLTGKNQVDYIQWVTADLVPKLGWEGTLEQADTGAPFPAPGSFLAGGK